MIRWRYGLTIAGFEDLAMVLGADFPTLVKTAIHLRGKSTGDRGFEGDDGGGAGRTVRYMVRLADVPEELKAGCSLFISIRQTLAHSP